LDRFTGGTVQVPNLRSVAGRIVEWLEGIARVPPAGLWSGLDGHSADALPVVLLVQPGADESAVRRTVEAIPSVCASALVRIVLVLDHPHLTIARRAGVVVELLPHHAALEVRCGGESLSQLAADRLALLREDYAAAATVLIPGQGLDGADIPKLADGLRSDSQLNRGRVYWRRALAGIVARLDPPVERKTRGATRSWRVLQGPR
jgi:hypothetical protein